MVENPTGPRGFWEIPIVGPVLRTEHVRFGHTNLKNEALFFDAVVNEKLASLVIITWLFVIRIQYATALKKWRTSDK